MPQPESPTTENPRSQDQPNKGTDLAEQSLEPPRNAQLEQEPCAGPHFRLSVAGGKVQDIEGKGSASAPAEATFTTPA